MVSLSRRSLRGIDRSTINSTQQLTTINVNLFTDANGNPSNISATDNVRTGSSSATATSTANTGIFNTPITLNRRGRVQVLGQTTVTATAQGDASGNLSSNTSTADARFTNDTGGILNFAADASGVPTPLRDVASNLLGGYAPTTDNDLIIKQTGQVVVEVANTATALASGATGATATADFTDASGQGGFFGIANTDILIGQGAQPAAGTTIDGFESYIDSAVYGGLNTTANALNGNATATTGDNTSTTNIAGIYNVGVTQDPSGAPLTITFGQSGAVLGAAGYELVDIYGNLIPVDASGNPDPSGGFAVSDAITLTATADTTNGDASANVLAGVVAGIFNDNVEADASGNIPTAANDLQIQIGGPLSIVQGDAFVNTDASATSVSGNAGAIVDITTVAGIADADALNGDPNDSSINFLSSGTVNATALSRNNAEAYTDSSGAGTAIAAVNSELGGNQIVGLALDQVTFGLEGSLGIQAQSFQNASAGSVVTGADPYAEVAWENQVVGVLNTDITVGTDLQGVAVAAGLYGTATATSISDASGTQAFAGDGAQVAGFKDSSLIVGGSIVPGQGQLPPLQVIAESDLQATATAESGPVTAGAGGVDRSGNPISSVIGIENTDINVGGTGNIAIDVSSNVVASATTNGSVPGSTADAIAANFAAGINQSDLEFGFGVSGELLDIDVTQTGSATAIGGDPNALLNLQAAGVNFGVGDGISVLQGTGSLNAAVVNGGNVSALAGSLDLSGVFVPGVGDAIATGTITSVGLDLEASGSFVDLGTTGSITSFSQLGILDGSGNLGTATVTARTNTGDADASGSFLNSGILGNDAPNAPVTTLNAGSLGGGINGTAYSNGAVTATSVTGDASANLVGGTVGIYNADLFGGSTGTNAAANAIVGDAQATFKAAATTTNGNATAISSNQVGGLLAARSSRRSLRTAGNVTANAVLNDTVTATTQNGIATATSTSDVVGIRGYDIVLTGPSSEINVLAGGVISTTSTKLS